MSQPCSGGGVALLAFFLSSTPATADPADDDAGPRPPGLLAAALRTRWPLGVDVGATVMGGDVEVDQLHRNRVAADRIKGSDQGSRMRGHE